MDEINITINKEVLYLCLIIIALISRLFNDEIARWRRNRKMNKNRNTNSWRYNIRTDEWEPMYKDEPKNKAHERKFTTSGYYWDPKENKWIAPDYENIPRDYHWDEVDCRWLPPEHPNHPKYHMNDKEILPESPPIKVQYKKPQKFDPRIKIDRKGPTFEEWKAAKEAELKREQESKTE